MKSYVPRVVNVVPRKRACASEQNRAERNRTEQSGRSHRSYREGDDERVGARALREEARARSDGCGARQHGERRGPQRGAPRRAGHEVAHVVRPSRVHHRRLVHVAGARGGDDAVALVRGEEAVHEEHVGRCVELPQAVVEAIDGDVGVQGIRGDGLLGGDSGAKASATTARGGGYDGVKTTRTASVAERMSDDARRGCLRRGVGSR